MSVVLVRLIIFSFYNVNAFIGVFNIANLAQLFN